MVVSGDDADIDIDMVDDVVVVVAVNRECGVVAAPALDSSSMACAVAHQDTNYYSLCCDTVAAAVEIVRAVEKREQCDGAVAVAGGQSRLLSSSQHRWLFAGFYSIHPPSRRFPQWWLWLRHASKHWLAIGHVCGGSCWDFEKDSVFCPAPFSWSSPIRSRTSFSVVYLIFETVLRHHHHQTWS